MKRLIKMILLSQILLVVFVPGVSGGNYIDDWRPACVTVVGNAIDQNTSIIPDENYHWLRSGVAYCSAQDTLFVVSDISALGTTSIRNHSVDDYSLNIVFNSGIALPVNSVSLMDSLAVLCIYTGGVLVEMYDYLVPDIVTQSELATGSEVVILNSMIGAGSTPRKANISNLGGIDSRESFDFVELIMLDVPTAREECNGAPVFLDGEGDGIGLLGVVANRGPSTGEYTYVMPLPSNPDWVYGLARYSTNASDFYESVFLLTDTER